MRIFPDNPNLDHLRQQAKDLLAGLRETEPSTSLAVAQASLAEQYGFAGWTELKAEVDRKRGRADIADQALAHAIAHGYDLGAVAGGMRSMAPPDESGRQWSLHTDRGRWVVRTMDTWWPIVDVETEVALQHAVAAAGVALPAPVRSRSGNIVESISGHSWRVCEWPRSGPPLSAPASSSVTRAVGEILATIHTLALPVDRVSPWHQFRLSEVEWPELAAKATAQHAVWAAELTEAVPTLMELDAIGEGIPVPEPVLSHNALGPGCVRRGTNGRLIVLGWEHAGGQPPSWELCNVLMTWTIDPGGGVNIAGARALVDGYRTTAGSVPALDVAMFRGAANSLANYVSGQLHHAMAVSDSEERRQADRSVRHVLTHLPDRAAFERILDVVFSPGRGA